MSDDEIARAVVALEKQEVMLLEALKKFEDQLVRVRTARTALTALQNEEPLPFDGTLATAIRTVLIQSKNSFEPLDVRNAVKALGYVFKEDQNQMAAVHGVLKRLVDSDEVKTKEWKKRPGVTRYYWNPDAPPPQSTLIPLSRIGAMWPDHRKILEKDIEEFNQAVRKITEGKGVSVRSKDAIQEGDK